MTPRSPVEDSLRVVLDHVLARAGTSVRRVTVRDGHVHLVAADGRRAVLEPPLFVAEVLKALVGDPP